jgi:hypothetical protein
MVGFGGKRWVLQQFFRIGHPTWSAGACPRPTMGMWKFKKGQFSGKTELPRRSALTLLHSHVVIHVPSVMQEGYYRKTPWPPP